MHYCLKKEERIKRKNRLKQKHKDFISLFYRNEMKTRNFGHRKWPCYSAAEAAFKVEG